MICHYFYEVAFFQRLHSHFYNYAEDSVVLKISKSRNSGINDGGGDGDKVRHLVKLDFFIHSPNCHGQLSNETISNFRAKFFHPLAGPKSL